MTQSDTTKIAHIVNTTKCAALAVKASAAEAGGLTALARSLGLNRKTIYNWSRAGKVPVEPTNYALAVEKITGLPRWFLRPDIYEWPQGAVVATSIGIFQLDRKL